MEIKEKICASLKEAYPDLMLLADPHYLIGSSALILSGVSINHTSDIDLVVSMRDALLLESLWKQRLVSDYKPARSDLFRSRFSRYHFSGLDIEVIGELEVCKTGEWLPLAVDRFEIFSTPGFEILLPSLEQQIRILTLFGREKDIAKITLIKESLAV